MTRAPVNRIIDQSNVDGPGNRTAFFLQGCNFNCGYCHNPETIHMCVSWGECVPACPTGALQMANGVVCYDVEKCCNCDTCISLCQHDASPKIVWMTPEEGTARLEKNRPFIRGVTVSGGECSLRRDFVCALFKNAKEMGLGTLMDSNGTYDFSGDAELMTVCDGIMLDMKCADGAVHIALTGQSNEMVLNNLDYLASAGKLEEVRTVVIPNSLPNEDTVRYVCGRLTPFWNAGANIGYKLIRFRPMGVRIPFRENEIPDDALMEHLRTIALKAGCRRVTII
jgi:pyruvate formate lyase activating enzyme